MNIYVALGIHAIFAILWFLDSRTLQRRRVIRTYYRAEEAMNAMLTDAAKTLVTELDSWRLEKDRNNASSHEELHELSQKMAWEEMKSRLNHPTNNRADLDIDISHILDDKLSKQPKKKAGPWHLIVDKDLFNRELGGPNSGMWKKPKSDE
ncbi:MAG: hypothetical protein ACKN9V_06905 [Pseudomonadota bacterium]